MPQFQRFLIACGTGRYDNLPADQQLPSVYADLEQVSGWFTAHGYKRVLVPVSEDPTSDELKNALGEWFSERTASDHVVFYYSGHGECIEQDGHYLACRNAKYREDGALHYFSALHDEEIAKAIANSKVQHALIILDTCFSTAGLFGFSKKAADLFRGRHYELNLPHGIHLIAASREWQKAKEGVFSPALCAALANREGKLGGALQEFLLPEAVVGAVNQTLRPSQVAQCLCATPRAGPDVALLPNPRFEPGRPEGLTLAEHWIPKAQGGSLDSRVGYFTGRERALRELVAWLSAPQSDGKARVVTGSAGCGKSALLGRLVLLADPEQRASAEAAGVVAKAPPDTVPPVGCLDLRIHARGKTLAEIGAEIRKALAVATGLPAEIVTALKARKERFALVVDALDEAKEPAKIARELLRPMAPVPAVRLLLGTRSDVAAAQGGRRFVGLGQATLELDLDRPDYLGESDLADYLKRRLLAAEEPERATPYRGRDDLAGPVATALARRCRQLFLIARLVADRLIEQKQPLTAAQAASMPFPDTVGKAFEEYLRRFEDDPDFSQAAAVDLLRPLAYAEGAGLPFGHVWPALATALAGREYVDQDIDRLKQRAGSFVIESLEDGQSVYRLYHEALAEHLRDGRNREQDQRSIVQALLALVPPQANGPPAWLSADPYIRNHLASHAANGAMLGELVSDPVYLVAAERRRLLRAIRELGASESTAVYESAFHNLGAAEPGERLAYLELAAHQHGRRNFLERAEVLDLTRPWRVAWANWAGTGAHREIARFQGSIVGLLLCELEDRTLIIVATYFVEELRDGTIRYSEVLAYDLADGSLQFHTGHLSSVALTGIALAEWNGEPVVVAASREGQIMGWRARDGQRLGEPVVVQRAGTEVCDLGHLVTAVINDHACAGFSAQSLLDVELVTLLDFWDLETGEPIFEQPIRLESTEVVGLAVLAKPPFEVLVSADSGRIRLWDLNTRTLREESEPIDRLNALAAKAEGDQLRIVIGAGESIQVWKAFDGALKLDHEPRAGHADGVTYLEVSRLGDEDVILSSGRDNVARVWRLSNSELLFQTLVGFADLPTHVALGRHRHRTELITADLSRALRAWQMAETNAPAQAQARALPHCGWVDSLNIIETGSAGWCIATRSRDGTVGVWQAETGEPFSGPLGAAVPDQAAMTAGLVGNRLTLFLCNKKGDLVRRDETSASRAIHCGEADGKVARYLAVVRHREADYLVSVDTEGLVVVRDLVTERIVIRFQSGLDHPRSQVGVVDGEGGPFLVTNAWNASSFTIWQLLDGNQSGSGSSRAGTVSPFACATIEGRPLLLASHDEKGLLLWDLQSGRSAGDFHFWGQASALALAELDGLRFAACADRNSRLHVWRGQERIASIQTDCTVQQLAFVPGPGILVAGCEGMMRLRL